MVELGGIRVDVNEELNLSFCENSKKRNWGGGGVDARRGRGQVEGGQGGCDRRIEVFGKIQKKNWGGGVGLVGGGGGSRWM